MEAGQVHPGLLGAWAFAEKVRREMLTAIQPLSPIQWAFRPSNQTWCIGEVVEHLLLSDIASSKMVRKLIRGDYQNMTFLKDARLHGLELDGYPFGTLDAPQILVPGPLRERTILESDLRIAHERFRSELAQFRGNDPEVLRSPDPATGEWFTLGGWIKLHAWHERHHLAQIYRLTAAPGFP